MSVRREFLALCTAYYPDRIEQKFKVCPEMDDAIEFNQKERYRYWDDFENKHPGLEHQFESCVLEANVVSSY